MAELGLEANHFTFTGENTHIVYFTQAPGPIHPGEDPSKGQLEYQGVEGSHTFRGNQIDVQSTPLGTLITVVLKVNNDTGGLNFTLILPNVRKSGKVLHFQTLGIKTATRGFILSDGPDATYSVFPLFGTADNVIIPL